MNASGAVRSADLRDMRESHVGSVAPGGAQDHPRSPGELACVTILPGTATFLCRCFFKGQGRLQMTEKRTTAELQSSKTCAKSSCSRGVDRTEATCSALQMDLHVSGSTGSHCRPWMCLCVRMYKVCVRGCANHVSVSRSTLFPRCACVCFRVCVCVCVCPDVLTAGVCGPDAARIVDLVRVRGLADLTVPRPDREELLKLRPLLLNHLFRNHRGNPFCFFGNVEECGQRSRFDSQCVPFLEHACK